MWSITRKGVGILAVLMFLALSSGCSREDRSPPHSIGIFQMNSAPHLDTARDGFLKALEDAGFKIGVDVRTDIKDARGHGFTARMIARKFVNDRVDLICAISTPCLQAALEATRTIPIIFISTSDPHGSGVDHRANVTGIVGVNPVGRAMDFIKEALPRTRRLGTLWNPIDSNSQYYVKLTKGRAKERGIRLVAWPVYDRAEMVNAARCLVDRDIDAIYQIPDATVAPAFESEVRIAGQRDIPVFVGQLGLLEKGACAAVGQDFFDLGYRAGQLAFRVLNGKPPGKIPFQVVEKEKMYINLKAANDQGVILPKRILNKADKVIEKGIRMSGQ